MDDRNNNRYSHAQGASRPPASEWTEDTPLFTEVPYTPTRRTGNNGRPASPQRTAAPENSGSSPYGGRSYTASSRSGGARSAAGGQRPGQTNRAAPVYTELSWDDLMRGGDLGQSRQPSSPSRPSGGAVFPEASSQSRSGSQYFGGFDQEMEELFYGRERNAVPPQSAPTPRQEHAPRQSAGPSVFSRSADQSAAGNRPQTTRRSAPPPSNIPAPAQRASSSLSRPQWTGVFGGSGTGRTPSRQPSRSSDSAARSSGGTPPTPTRRAGSRTRARQIPPLFLGGGVVLLALLIFLAVRLTGGSNSGPSRPTPAKATAEPLASFEPVLTPEPVAEATPAPTPAPSPTPSGPKAKKVGDLVVPADWGPTIPERSRAVYDSYFDKSCMVGNSLVEGFLMWSGMTNLRYIYHTGATVNDAIGKLDLAPITLNPPGYYDNIYLLFGLNEIGNDVNSFVQGYKKLVDFIREYQPKANIILISVTPVTRQVDGDPNEVQSMDRIRTFNAALQEFCVDQNCWYLDIYNLLLDAEGYLSGDYAFVGDGKHFEKSGYVAWANYMKTHYVDEKLLTE